MRAGRPLPLLLASAAAADAACPDVAGVWSDGGSVGGRVNVVQAGCRFAAAWQKAGTNLYAIGTVSGNDLYMHITPQQCSCTSDSATYSGKTVTFNNTGAVWTYVGPLGHPRLQAPRTDCSGIQGTFSDTGSAGGVVEAVQANCNFAAVWRDTELFAFGAVTGVSPNAAVSMEITDMTCSCGDPGPATRESSGNVRFDNGAQWIAEGPLPSPPPGPPTPPPPPAPPRPRPLPIIIDTDIGDDFDDSWALTAAIARPDLWDVRLVLTAAKNTTARAQIVAKYLTRYKRTDIPIGIGVHTSDAIGSLYPWAADVSLGAYTAAGGTVHADGVRAAVDILTTSPEPVYFVAIAPESNFGAIAEQYPEAVAKVAGIYAMFGGVDYCYDHRPVTTPGSCVEYNVVEDVHASQAMVGAAWPMTITPLDTCSYAMNGTAWQRMLAANSSAHPLVATLLESIVVWNPAYGPGSTQSDVIFDAVAQYMSDSVARLEMAPVRLRVADNGASVRDAAGKLMQVALAWRDGGLDGFMNDLADWIIAPTAVPPRRR